MGNLTNDQRSVLRSMAASPDDGPPIYAHPATLNQLAAKGLIEPFTAPTGSPNEMSAVTPGSVYYRINDAGRAEAKRDD